ncbi:MAG TPA: hypothetical protein VFB04_11810 [Terriglobales bacterium]|nr:hypothetical protein [Terriglobales bacterium]
MRRSRRQAALLIGFLLFFLAAFAIAQEPGERSAANATAQAAGAEQSGGGANAGVAQILANTTEQSAKSAEKWGDRLGIGPKVSFAISLGLNFAGIAIFVWVLVRSRLPQAFRERTATIQRSIREAQAASADASRRLTEIEARLGKLDSEVAEIRQSAEQEAAAEEERVREAAEQDKQRIVEGAEAEIAAIARNARRELKGYAAALAVDLAAREIHVDDSTDQALVRDFVEQLGKDGQ